MNESLSKIFRAHKEVAVITFLLIFAVILFSYASFQQNNIGNMRFLMSESEKIAVDAQANKIEEELNNIDNDLDTVTIIVNPLPTVDFTFTNNQCSGSAIPFNSSVSGAGGYTYSWSPSGGTAATASGLSAGSYTVTITDVKQTNGTYENVAIHQTENSTTGKITDNPVEIVLVATDFTGTIPLKADGTVDLEANKK